MSLSDRIDFGADLTQLTEQTLALNRQAFEFSEGKMPARVFAAIQKSCADSFCQFCLRGLGRGKDVCYNHFMSRRAADIFMDGERKEENRRPQTLLSLAGQRAGSPAKTGLALVKVVGVF